MNFKHELPALEIDLLNFPMEFADEECEMPHSDATIHFSVNVDARSNGIKGIYTHSDKIEIGIGEHELCIHEFDPATINGEADDQWEVLSESDMSNSGMIIPDRLELDWKTKKAYVYY